MRGYSYPIERVLPNVPSQLLPPRSLHYFPIAGTIQCKVQKYKLSAAFVVHEVVVHEEDLSVRVREAGEAQVRASPPPDM